METGRKLDNYGRIVNDPKEKGKCLICNKNKQRKRGPSDNSASGEVTYNGICQSCHEAKIKSNKNSNRSSNRGKKLKYRKHKKNKCEKCGFTPKHKCQLDVDHIDNDHNNNDPSNLQTLCANCHRLKTQKERELSVSERDILVKEFYKEQKEFKASLPKMKLIRKREKGIRYRFYIAEEATKEEILNAFIQHKREKNFKISKNE